MLMNARHFFYGPALYGKLSMAPRQFPLASWAFGLTDEVFAASVTQLEHRAPKEREAWYIGMQLGAYLAWVGGTMLGVMFNQLVQDAPYFVIQALDFVLPALFLVLLLDMKPLTNRLPISVAVVVCVLLLSVLPAHFVLIVAILAAMLCSMLKERDYA